jgi:DNA-binding NarL/FixJ family response regulator
MPKTIKANKRIDWDAVATRYFKTEDSVRAIARSFGVSDAAVRRHATENGWVRRPVVDHPEDIGRLASSLALAMISIDGVTNRARRFVAAMAKLGASAEEIADSLEISEKSLRSDFQRELSV